MRGLIVALAIGSALGGCASTSESWFGRPIRNDHLQDPEERHKLEFVSGDYRLIRVEARARDNPADGLLADAQQRWLVCAETQADAIAARGASSTLTIAEEGELGDSVTRQLTATNQRSAVSDVVRQLGWQLCNARLNGDLSDDEYRDTLLEMSRDAFEALTPPPAAPAKPASPAQ